MRFRANGILLVGLVLILAACGRVNPGAGLPSPSSSPSHQTPPINIPISAFHVGEVGFAYAPVTINASGGKAPYVWMISDGALPGGLTISFDGTVAGTPTASGIFAFTVEVVDAGKAMAYLGSSITIVPMLTASLAQSDTIVVELGHTTGAFGAVTGGNAPYTYAVTAGAVPPGTSLDGLSLAGSFSSAGNHTFTTTVTDSLGATASISPAYYVFAPIAFPARAGQWDATCSGSIDRGCSTELAYSGGAPGITPVLTWSTATTTLQPVPVPYANGHTDLATPTLSGGAVQVQWLSDRLGTGGGVGWDGVVIVTLTDPVTHESTSEGYIHISVH
jgi:hypothetical protein